MHAATARQEFPPFMRFVTPDMVDNVIPLFGLSTHMEAIMKTKRALILVDLCGAFFKNGGLPVPGAEETIPGINKLIMEGDENGKFDLVVASYEEHRPGNLYLASTHGVDPFTDVVIDGNPKKVWPDHGMTGTDEAKFYPGLRIDLVDAIFRKGYDLNTHPYSSFPGKLMWNGVELPVDLVQFLRANGITEIVVVGLAFDYCAGETALDGVEFGFKTSILRQYSPAIAEESAGFMFKRLFAARVEIVN
ncbi:MAG: Nicotinamidase-like protein amidase [Parcubacteria group bacterium GW2011_GWC2_39_14]|nr:MAG: Nicotinamidase-like protein amidase [Parcubacteria group bacterium GW2011_GWC2_39_14]KKR55006.1 MAG: Nicotinamidase-like protein amidase [Parcubacteria group bacterium GW2011_GWA2_40_23]